MPHGHTLDSPSGVRAVAIIFNHLQRHQLIVGDAARLDLADGSVDVVVSNLGINNFDDAAAVLGECHRVLRPGGRLVISSNLVGHMQEFYDVLRGRVDENALLEHVKRRATVDGTVKLLEAAGFRADVEQGSFVLRFADGTALFEHYFIRLAFLDGWLELAGQEVLDEVEQELNRRGEVRLTIPTACFDAVRA